MDTQFILRRIHSLTGVIPVGLFLVYHLYGQLYLHEGAEKYNEVVNGFYDHPLALPALIVFVYIPLFFHSFLGLFYTFEAQVQPQYTYFTHLLYWLQRLSGVGVLLFVAAHLWNTQIGQLIAGTYGEHFEHLEAGFHDPTSGLVTKAVYVLGVLGANFHLANGIHTFSMTWGIALSEDALKRARAISIVVFAILTVLSGYALSAIW